MNGWEVRSSHHTSMVPATSAIASTQSMPAEMLSRNTSRASIAIVNKTMPRPSMPGRSSRAGSRPVVRGNTTQPRTRLARPSGRFTANVALHPHAAMSTPPSVGPITDTVCVVTDRAVRIPAGEDRPVRCASARIMCIAAG